METFHTLADEKRERIINAAMTVFSAHGYRKTSVADIARAADISKAMVFTYFGTKKGLYEYLTQHTIRETYNKFKQCETRFLSETDFFERFLLSARYKLEIMQYSPALLDFSASLYLENDPEVRPLIDNALKDTHDMRAAFLGSNIDTCKFKKSADIAAVAKLTTWFSNGCIDDWNHNPQQSLEEIMAIFEECLCALKKYYYKEEYLHDTC